MNPRVIPAVALLAAVAACAWFFLSSDTSRRAATPDSASDSQRTGRTPSATQPAAVAEKNHASENSPDAAGKKPAVNWKRFAALLGGSGGEPPPQATAAEIEHFIAAHGETAMNLAAAFVHTHDRRWLDRALELFPNNPVVLLAAINAQGSGATSETDESRPPDAERMALIERFKTADPNNPVPWLFAAQELFKAKQTVEAVAEIRAAIERPAFYSYARERTDAMQRLYEDLGLGSLEASVFAEVCLPLPHMDAAQQSSRSLMELQKIAVQSGDTAGAEDAIRLTYSLGRMFATPEASRLLIGELVGVSMENRALAALPPDAQRDYLTVTPAQRIAELQKQKQTVKDLVAASLWLYQSQDEQLFAEYYRRLRSDSEFAALTWLKTQQKK